MKTFRQMLRQPVKTFFGIILLAAATAALIICVGQAVRAAQSRLALEEKYSTVALTNDTYRHANGYESASFDSDTREWLMEFLASQPDGMKLVSQTGLTTAYIPELVPDIFTQHFSDIMWGLRLTRGMPYCTAMLEITITSVGESEPYMGQEYMTKTYDDPEYVTVLCEGVVESVVCLSDGYDDPTGYRIRLTVKAESMEALEEKRLKVGQRYLVYGMDYTDLDAQARYNASLDEENYLTPYSPDRIMLNSGKIYYRNIVDGQETGKEVLDRSLFQSGSLTACNYAALPDVTFGFSMELGTMVYYLHTEDRVRKLNADADTASRQYCDVLPVDEYRALYDLPDIAMLSGTAEDFLQSEEGVLWRKALEAAEINSHAFPVLAVDKLGYQAEFARQHARVVEGRDFTADELDNGSHVLIMEQALAYANGVSIGDTLSLRMYDHDPNLMLHDHDYPQSAYPDASFFSHAYGFAEEADEFTVIGFYQHDDIWNDTSYYGFWPNTVFIPRKAAAGTPVTGIEGVLQTIVLENGKIDAFDAALASEGYEGMFTYYDQGYTQIVESLDAYQIVSMRAALIGLIIYLLLLLMYLLFFPGSQCRTLAIMNALGASDKYRFLHLLLSGIGILLPATVIGTLFGLLLESHVTAWLMELSGTAFTMTPMSVALSMALAGVQIVFSIIMIMITAAIMTSRSHRREG